jgi:hypothetical protein
MPKVRIPAYVTTGDLVLIVTLFIFSITFLLMTAIHRQPGAMASVEIDGRRIALLDLSKNRVITIRGNTGNMDIQVQDHKVRVSSSGCPQKICVQAGYRYKAGDVIVCVPNKIVVRIISRDEKNLDIITG